MVKADVAVRQPPTDAQFALHLPQVRGKCRWCGLPTDEKGRFYWHTVCQDEFYIIIRPDVARRAVEQRDRGICCDCGEDWTDRYLLRKSGSQVMVSDGWFSDKTPEQQAQHRAERVAGFWVYSELVWISLWHVDHKVPLWKVRGLPPLQRLEYFKLPNLVTRCHKCHQRKTDKESAERARFDRLAEPRPSKPKARIQSRPFPPKGSRPMKRK